MKRLAHSYCFSAKINSVYRLVTVGLVFLFLNFASIAQENSVLAEGDWYKIAVDQSGVYKLDREFLKALGIDVNTIDPRSLKLYGNVGGMLPQSNSDMRPQDLIENAIWVIGENDGSFDEGDLVVFYAHGPDKYTYDDNGQLTYQQNIYSRKNYYYLTIGPGEGQRVSSQTHSGVDYPKISHFNDFGYHEQSLTNLLISGRNWYGERFDATTQYTIDFEVTGLLDQSPIKVTSNVMAQSFSTSQFKVELNGQLIGTHTVESVPDFRQSIYRYSVKGEEDTQLFQTNSASISPTEKLALNYSYEKNSSGQSVGFLDYAMIEFQRELRWYGETTQFRSLESLNNTTSTYEIPNSDNSLIVWNVTTPNTPFQQEYTLNGNTARYGAESATLQEYVMFTLNSATPPEPMGKVLNQNLRGQAAPDLLIVTHPDFSAEAFRLANFRRSHDGLSVLVVTTEQIYNEFSSGRQDVTAIRDYARHLYSKGSQLSYLLLFGRGSYDYLDIIPNNTNYVPIYESRNSLHPLNTYGSDDYYGFLEDNEGEWAETFSGSHTLDIGIGRLPISSLEEARHIVNKLIHYSTDKNVYGSWRNRVTFVADDGDFNLHQRQSDQLSRLIDTTFQSYNPEKLYLDAFEQISKPNGEVSPAASQALDEAVDNGSLIINFTGHGGEVGWMQEQVLDLIMIQNWTNFDRLPLFVTATCEFSRHDDPRRVSGGERVVSNPNGGGIGIVSTCRPVSSSSNFQLNKAFYDVVFQRKDDQYLRLGDIIRLTKNTSTVNQVGNRNFALLGDPSLQLSYPDKDLVITKTLNNNVASDTINALSRMQIEGKVQNRSGSLDESFNGTLYATVYDKESLFTTLGNESTPFDYFAKQNIIFKGKASIENGLFQFEFIVPKNISYQLDLGKISLYATHDKQNQDAGGSHFVTVGGSAAVTDTDNIGPDIRLYLGDTLNNTLHDIASNTNLLARLKDESGINLSGFGIGNNIEVNIDDSITLIANNFYEATTDSYQEGWVDLPIKGLAKGEHRLTLKAWDVYNNSSAETIHFTVLDPDKLSISRLLNYPNPFSTATTFSFSHNRAGESLTATLEIFNRVGSLVQKFEFNLNNSQSTINLPIWDGTNSNGEKLQSGLYIFKLSVRSTIDGAFNERYEKFVLIN